MNAQELRIEFVKMFREETGIELDLHEVSTNINYTDFIEKKIMKFVDYHFGLYAFDFDPKDIINRFVTSQSDACGLFTEQIDKLQEDWHRWCNNENIVKSPFFKIDCK